MPSKRFQSGHEVMVAFVKDYLSTPRRDPIYHDLPEPLLSGDQLGRRLLEELRSALQQSHSVAKGSGESAP